MGNYVQRILDNHPGIVISCAYIYISTLGILSDSVLSAQFNIHVLSFFDTRDLLFAGLRNWIPLFLSAVPVAYLVAGVLLLRFLDGAQSRDMLEKYRKQLLVSAAVVACIVVPSFTSFYAVSEANRIRSGDARSVRVLLRNGLSGGTAASVEELYLIVTTQNYLLFYDRKGGASRVVPSSQIVSLAYPQ